MISWDAVARRPGEPVSQTNPLPGLHAVIAITHARSFGCLIPTLDPTPIGPASRRWIVEIEGVHSGQVSTSDKTSQTRAAGSAMKIS